MSEDVGPVLAALADETRRGIVGSLAEGATPTATELADGLPMTRQAVAKHLGVLEKAGLVTAARSGRETRYRLEGERLRQTGAWLEAVGARWDRRLAELKDQVEREAAQD